MSSPFIGVTANHGQNDNGDPTIVLGESYTQAVLTAGGVPVIIPLDLPDEALQELVDRLDGILFTGGGDIHGRYYQAENHPMVRGIDEDRDRIEIGLFKDLVHSGKPFLGICRGIQLINIAAGGTLYADIQDQMPGGMKHAWHAGYPRDFLAHEVEVTEGSRLRQILGQRRTGVNSLHHQGVAELAPGLKAVAYAPDGLVEAVEMEAHPFGLGVQWHPECLQQYAPMRDLFRAFIEAAGASG